PGDTTILESGKGDIRIIEYSTSSYDSPEFVLLASEARNYNAQLLAIDTAVAKGLLSIHPYFSVLGHSPDGDISNIDYEVTELSVTDNRIFFGNDIIPLVRLVTKMEVSVPTLPAHQVVTAFPNPANDFVNVKFEFTKGYETIMLTMVDNGGRTVYSKLYNQ